MKKNIFIFMSMLMSINIISADELKIEGNDIVEIAMQGESIVQYQIPEGYQLTLQEEVEGVMIDDKAILHVSPEAKEGWITLIAQGDQTITKEIQLISSWTMTVEGAQVYQIPNPQQTRRIDYMDNVYEWIPAHVLRICLCVTILSISTLYIFKRRKR